MPKKIYLLIVLFPFILKAQTDIATSPATSPMLLKVNAVVVDGDTIPSVNLSAVYCGAPRTFKTYRQKVAWDRLKYNTKKVYPYAILAAAKLKEYDRVLALMPENQRGAYTKLAEEQLKNEFGDELKNLSVNQGRLLIKLIDRETGKTTYDVVKNMRGSFSAFMWQGVALMFNSSLKADYDPEGNEKDVEAAIKLIEDGQF